MRIQNDERAWGFLAGLFVLLLGVLVNANCTRDAPVHAIEKVEPTRSPMEAASFAVEIDTECGVGSGVLVDEVHVITAFHVVNCLVWPLAYGARNIEIKTRAGETRRATIEVADGARDLARLRIREPLEVTHVAIRAALEDDIVCAVTAVPERAFRCGLVTTTGDKPRYAGDVVAKYMDIWFGNSGSGVYNRNGILVGIVVRLMWCDNADAVLYKAVGLKPDHTCGAMVSSIIDSPVML